MKTIYFVTPTQMSFIDLITMGDSEKRGDNRTIGQFASGLKYSLALLLRNNISFSATVKGNTFIGGRDRDYSEIFTPYTYTLEDDFTGKGKDLIGIKVERDFESFHSQFDEDIFECIVEESYETGFALQLGYNWELWMAIREIYSNMLDEGGHYFEEEEKPLLTHRYGTKIEISFEEGSEFDDLWKNRKNFIKEDGWEWELSHGVKVCRNSDTWLKIFKNNILVHENREVQTNFSFSCESAEIDERRLIINEYSCKNDIALALTGCKDESLVRLLVADKIKEDSFLGALSDVYEGFPMHDVFFNVVDEVVEQCGDFQSYDFLKKRIKKDKRYVHSGRVLSTLTDSYFSYTKSVVVDSVPVVTEEVKTIQDQITSKYKIDLSEITVKESPLTGSSCVADKFNKTIIINNSFDIEQDMVEFIIQYYCLTTTGNIITTLATALEQHIKK